jgi:2-polyprenyl-6-hydroxyphenyl methylase/3-demethylubiquinone-9 3-methyltransferase
LGKIAAEYLLRWAPPGTHDWGKFVTPGELAAMVAAAGLTPDRPVGLAYDALGGTWRRAADCGVNFMIAAARPAARSPPPGEAPDGADVPA